MTDIFHDKTLEVGGIREQLAADFNVTQGKMADRDRFYNEARLPGERKYPNDVVSVERPRRGHDY
jgi:hypothetical protein